MNKEKIKAWGNGHIPSNGARVQASCAKRTVKHLLPSKRVAFTLAEVLITLGIIGVVAALTLPSVIENHQKKSTAVKLQKFYSVMNQALLHYQNDEGLLSQDFVYPEEVKRNGKKLLEWFDDTIGKYIKTTERKASGIDIFVAFADGSGFVAYANSTYMPVFYCTEYKQCGHNKMDGKKSFLFTISNGKLYASFPSMQNSQNYTREKLLQLCKYGNYDNAEESIKGKRHACARLIEYDGWEIKDDYPWRQIILEK